MLQGHREAAFGVTVDHDDTAGSWIRSAGRLHGVYGRHQHLLAKHPLEFTGPKGLRIGQLGEPTNARIGHRQADIEVGSQLAVGQGEDLVTDDDAQVAPGERFEGDDLVETVQELRREVALQPGDPPPMLVLGTGLNGTKLRL